MSAALETIAVIAGIVGTVTGVYYAARASARESQRQREAYTASKVTEATEPLKAQIADMRATHRDALTSVRDACTQQVAAVTRALDRSDATIAAQAARIDQLEDELRRGRGHGETNASRQPRD